MSAMLGTAVESALLLLEARRWWLDEYHVDHPMRDAPTARGAGSDHGGA